MTIPFDLRTTRAERPMSAADRGVATREFGPRDNAFPDALRSAVDRTAARDRAAQADARRDDRAAQADARRDDRAAQVDAHRDDRAEGPERSNRPDRDRGEFGRAQADRAAERRAAEHRDTDASAVDRVHERPGHATDRAGAGGVDEARPARDIGETIHAAVLAAVRASGVGTDARASVAEPNAAADVAADASTDVAIEDEVVQAVLDTVEEALPTLDESTLLEGLEELVAQVVEGGEQPTATGDALPADAVTATAAATAAATPAAATAAPTAATTATVAPTDDGETPTAAPAGDGETPAPVAPTTDAEAAPGQGHGPSASGARGLDRAAEVAAAQARVHQLAGDAPGDAATTRRVADQALRAAEQALAGRGPTPGEGVDAVRLPTTPLTGESLAAQAVSSARVTAEQVAAPGAAGLQRVLDALELLEQAPPPRQITLELGDARVRVGLEDGQVRLNVVGQGNDAVERWLEETRAALAERGFDLGQQARGDRDGRPDADGPMPAMAGAPPADTTSAQSNGTRADNGALRL